MGLFDNVYSVSDLTRPTPSSLGSGATPHTSPNASFRHAARTMKVNQKVPRNVTANDVAKMAYKAASAKEQAKLQQRWSGEVQKYQEAVLQQLETGVNHAAVMMKNEQQYQRLGARHASMVRSYDLNTTVTRNQLQGAEDVFRGSAVSFGPVGAFN